MSQQSEIYAGYLEKFYNTHEKIDSLPGIEKPDLTDAVQVDSVKICSSIYDIFKLSNGNIVSGQSSEWAYGMYSKWFEGSYQKVLDNKPMSRSEYFEF